MLLQDLSQDDVTWFNDKQWSLLEKLKEYRSKFGMTERMQISKALERTRPFTRTVYPQNWKAKY